MRLAVWHNLPSGGAKRLLAMHIDGLVQRGHHVEVWAPDTAETAYMPLGVPEHVLPLPAGGSASRRIDRHCREVVEQQGDRFDVLLAGNCRLTTVAPLGALSPLPSVLYAHEPNRRTFEATPLQVWLAQGPGWGADGLTSLVPRRFRDARRLRGVQGRARAEVQNAAAFDRLLVNSLYSRESFLRAYGMDSRVCYPGVDTEYFCPPDEPSPPSEPFLLGVGYLGAHKNVELVIRAAARIPDPRPPLVWVANAANAPYRERVVSLAEELQVQLRLEVGIGDAQLRDLYRRAALLLYAPRLEPFGLVPLEAAACGLPVVCIAEGGVRETIRDGVVGRLAEPSVAGLADVAISLLTIPQERAELAAAAPAHVAEHWSIARSVVSLERHLLAVAEAGS